MKDGFNGNLRFTHSFILHLLFIHPSSLIPHPYCLRRLFLLAKSLTWVRCLRLKADKLTRAANNLFKKLFFFLFLYQYALFRLR
jgi:hypothetical protein